MEAAPLLVCSKVTSFGPSIFKHRIVSYRHFHKQVERKFCTENLYPRRHCTTSKVYSFPQGLGPLLSSSPCNGRIPSLLRSQCSYSDTTDTDAQHPLLEILKGFSLESLKILDSLKMGISQLTPFELCKWALVFSIAIGSLKWTVNLLWSPFFWMYFSMTWVFWPWYVAVFAAMYGLYCVNKHLRGEANEFEQLAIATSAFTWLTLVPPAHFNGFLEGWPVLFFFLYHYFIFLNFSVRKRLYGDNYPRKHDPKWDISLPNWQKLLFCVGVMVGHWLAAFEGPELHHIRGLWSSVGVWGLIMMAIFMQYHSTLYLANYSEKVVVPIEVVQFGPYRFVRHPIYASTMLLFVAYCVALRAPLSALFIVVVCSLYYGNKAKLEECLMVANFGERYMEYASKVRYKLIPFVY